MSDAQLSILTLNVCCPSVPRAERQLDWLGGRSEQIFVLTEVGAASGSALLAERLRAAGWAVRAPVPRDGERGVMICARVAIGEEHPPPVSYLRERAEAVSVGKIEMIGVYVPSRDDSPTKVARKRRFLTELLTALEERKSCSTVLIGDLNIVERSQRGVDRVFREWEYELYEELPNLGWLDGYRVLHPDRVEVSWADSEGQGFRFDHTFITEDLRDNLVRCEYLHETREGNLSDHSAMLIELDDVPFQELDVDSSLAAGEPSLF
ncbi:MAG TPA: endonuclease/exonuclease/phosphatase family protein [Solirubrobacterales bacterium]|nr:endonuclease/exonuclease/phosphatase family protein [Solirubrobacterales bacterium]